MKRKIFLILVILAIAFGGFIVYLNKVLLPVKLKNILLENIQTSLHRKAAIESLQYNIFKGVEIKGLTIFESLAFKEEPFLKIKEINFNFLFLSLFKEKKVIIPSLKIDSPEFKLIREKDGLWNFSDLLNIKPSTQKISFLIYKVSVVNASCLFEDKTLESQFSKELKDFNLRANFALPSKIKFMFDGKVPSKDLFSIIRAKGEFDFAKLNLSSSLLIRDIDALDYRPYYANLPFSLKAGKIKNVNARINWQDGQTNITTQIETNALDLARDAYELKGAPLINAQLLYNTAPEAKLDYSISVNTNGLNVEGIPYLNNFTNVSGKIDISPNKIQFFRLQGTSNGMPVNASGAINDFINPAINLGLISNVDVSQIKEIFKEQLKSLAFDIKGNALLELQASGPLNDISKLAIIGNASFLNLVAQTSLLPEKIENITGKISFDANSLKWGDLKAEYSGEEYISNGALENFASPSVEADLKSRLIALSTKFNINKNILSLQNLEGKFSNSNFKLSGETDISEKENPLCNLTLGLEADLKDLKEALPQFKESIEKINPEGLIKFSGNFRGKLRDKESWQIRLNGESPQIALMGLKLSNLLLDYARRETTADFLNLAANSYGGLLEISGKVYPAENQLPFTLKGKIDNVDLAKLKMDTPFKDKPTYGTLSGEISLSGLAQNKESWQGRSSLSFKDGSLWELNFLKGLGKFLLIPEFEKIVINEATGDFSIADKNIHIEDLELKSSEMIINAEGDINFSGNLNIKLLTQFSEGLIQNSDSLKKFLTSIFTKASSVLTIKVTGTLQNPKYSVVPIVTDIIQDLKGIFKNILK